MPPLTLKFQSNLNASQETVWSWAVSVDGILTELRPLARMTVPKDIESILDVDVELGQPIAQSWLLLFGVIPIDRIDLTLIELEAGASFVEQSPMTMMRLWRHERTVETISGGARLSDILTFEGRFGNGLAKWFVNRLFTHRHQVLRRQFGEI